MPKRNEPIASGSMASARNRVAPIDVPPSALDSTAAKTPHTSIIDHLPFIDGCAP